MTLWKCDYRDSQYIFDKKSINNYRYIFMPNILKAQNSVSDPFKINKLH